MKKKLQKIPKFLNFQNSAVILYLIKKSDVFWQITSVSLAKIICSAQSKRTQEKRMITKIKVFLWNEDGSENKTELEKLRAYIFQEYVKPKCGQRRYMRHWDFKDGFLYVPNYEILEEHDSLESIVLDIRQKIIESSKQKNLFSEILIIHQNSFIAGPHWSFYIETSVNTFFYKALGKCPIKTLENIDSKKALKIINESFRKDFKLQAHDHGEWKNWKKFDNKSSEWIEKCSESDKEKLKKIFTVWDFEECARRVKSKKQRKLYFTEEKKREMESEEIPFSPKPRNLKQEDIEVLMSFEEFRKRLFYFSFQWQGFDYEYLSPAFDSGIGRIDWSKRSLWHGSSERNPTFIYCYQNNEGEKVYYDIQKDRVCHNDGLFPSAYKIDKHEITFDKNRIVFYCLDTLNFDDEKSNFPDTVADVDFYKDLYQYEGFSDEEGPFLITKDTYQYLLDKEGKKIWNVDNFDHFAEIEFKIFTKSFDKKREKCFYSVDENLKKEIFNSGLNRFYPYRAEIKYVGKITDDRLEKLVSALFGRVSPKLENPERPLYDFSKYILDLSKASGLAEIEKFDFSCRSIKVIKIPDDGNSKKITERLEEMMKRNDEISKPKIEIV